MWNWRVHSAYLRGTRFQLRQRHRRLRPRAPVRRVPRGSTLRSGRPQPVRLHPVDVRQARRRLWNHRRRVRGHPELRLLQGKQSLRGQAPEPLRQAREVSHGLANGRGNRRCDRRGSAASLERVDARRRRAAPR
jgi:hypothetical protein